MQNDLINKYLLNKQKTLLSYSKTLYKVYEIDDEKLWKTEDEFENLMNNILKIYINKYYLRDKKDLSNLNEKKLSDKDFKMTLALAVVADYFKDKYSDYKDKYKKSIYNLTLVLYIVTNADKEISFYNKYNVTTKNIVNLLNKLFSDVIGEAQIDKNPFIMEMLANKIKEAEQKEIRFFESIKDNESYISFLEYDKKSFYVDYTYDLHSLMKYDDIDVKYVYSKYKFKEQYMSVMYELSALTILKCFSNNCKVPNFLLPISSLYLKTKTSVDHLSKVFSNPYMKDKIMFSTYFTDYKNNYHEYQKLIKLGFKLVLFMDKSEIIVDYSNIKYDFIFYVTEEFIESNQKFLEFAQKGKVEYKVIKEIKKINEDELINICLKEEN